MAIAALGLGASDWRCPAGEAESDSAVDVLPVAIGEIRSCNLNMRGNDGGPTCQTLEPSYLWIELAVHGPVAQRATHYGRFQAMRAVDNRGNTLRLKPAVYTEDVESGFKQICSAQPLGTADDAPQDRISVPLYFDMPDRSAKSVSVRGTFELKVAQFARVVAGKIPTRPSRVESPELSQHGVELELVRVHQNPDGETWMTFELGGESARVRQVVMVGADGKSFTAGWPSPAGSDARREILFSQPAKKLEGASLMLEVEVDAETTEVPFDFQDLCLP